MHVDCRSRETVALFDWWRAWSTPTTRTMLKPFVGAEPGSRRFLRAKIATQSASPVPWERLWDCSFNASASPTMYARGTPVTNVALIPPYTSAGTSRRLLASSETRAHSYGGPASQILARKKLASCALSL